MLCVYSICCYIDRVVFIKQFKCRCVFLKATFAFSKLISVLNLCMCFYSLPHVVSDGTQNFHFPSSLSLSLSFPLFLIYAKLRREKKKDSSHSLNLIKINFISLLPIQFPVRRFLIHYRRFISMMHHKFYFTHSQNEFPDLLLNFKIKLKKK